MTTLWRVAYTFEYTLKSWPKTQHNKTNRCVEKKATHPITVLPYSELPRDHWE